MSRPRDGQQSKLWAAEDEVAAATSRSQVNASVATSFYGEPDATAFLQKTVRSAFWKKRAALAPTVRGNIGLPSHTMYRVVYTNKAASCVPQLPPSWNTPGPTVGLLRVNNQLHVLHNLAHLLHDPETPWHGREFCKEYLRLVRRFCAKPVGDALRASFTEHKVRARVVSEEAREKRREIFLDRKVPDIGEKLAQMVRDLASEDSSEWGKTK